MIIAVNELRNFVQTDLSDLSLTYIIMGLESFIKRYTNNDFIDRTTNQVNYPPDVRFGVINLCKWEIANRDKVGISSETISRHSVTYSNLDGENADFGFPSAMLGFLKGYMRARF